MRGERRLRQVGSVSKAVRSNLSSADTSSNHHIYITESFLRPNRSLFRRQWNNKHILHTLTSTLRTRCIGSKSTFPLAFHIQGEGLGTKLGSLLGSKDLLGASDGSADLEYVPIGNTDEQALLVVQPSSAFLLLRVHSAKSNVMLGPSPLFR